MASDSETARWSDLATHRDSESDSKDFSSSDSLLSEVLEHAGEQSLSSSKLLYEDAAEDFGSVEQCTFELLADSSSTDELPSSSDVDGNTVNSCLTCGKS